LSFAPHHLLSFSRLVLGAYVCAALAPSRQSAAVFFAVVLACLADYFDGKVARRSGTDSLAGRIVDNVCDVGFLALAFAGFAKARVWSSALGFAWPGAALDWLPLVALALSFGTYALRWLGASLRGAAPGRSARGHHAGIGNYVLALVGGAAVSPTACPPMVVGLAFIAVVTLNVVAGFDNARLLASEWSGERRATQR
jgi:phosphatidylglycerophosphate synthase